MHDANIPCTTRPDSSTSDPMPWLDSARPSVTGLHCPSLSWFRGSGGGGPSQGSWPGLAASRRRHRDQTIEQLGSDGSSWHGACGKLGQRAGGRGALLVVGRAASRATIRTAPKHSQHHALSQVLQYILIRPPWGLNTCDIPLDILLHSAYFTYLDACA
jgi:hypothetical protein